jgi:hypothetical protein
MSTPGTAPPNSRRAWHAGFRRARRAAVRAAAAALLLHASASAAGAQAMRVSGATTLRYIEMRPLVRDSIAADETAGTGLLRQLGDGRIVRCVPGEPFCSDVRAGSRVSTVPLIHDLEISAWGLGQGVRAYSQLRARSAWGGNAELWPGGTGELEVLAAYAELDRERLRMRVGRQWKTSGLGFYNFDGIALGARPLRGAWLEGYVGRSLLRGNNESRTGGALEAIDAFAPPSAGLLVGMQARYRPTSRFAISAVYQADFRDDGHGLYSELAAVDGVLRIGGGSVEASVEMDVAANALNEARLRVRSAPLGQVALHAEVRRYRPYFELWTIWGAFSPVGFDEARAGATWAEPRGRLMLRADAAYRSYGETSVNAIDELRGDSRSLSASANWLPTPQWRFDGAVRTEAGVGAARRDGHIGASRRFGEAASVSLQALAFQRLYEFRLNEGTVLGLGAEAAARVSDRARVFANAAVYRHTDAAVPAVLDWNQRRASVRVQWLVGREPVPGGAW